MFYSFLGLGFRIKFASFRPSFVLSSFLLKFIACFSFSLSINLHSLLHEPLFLTSLTIAQRLGSFHVDFVVTARALGPG